MIGTNRTIRKLIISVMNILLFWCFFLFAIFQTPLYLHTNNNIGKDGTKMILNVLKGNKTLKAIDLSFT